MDKSFGHIQDENGVYVLDKLPEAGNFEYIYKNKNIFLRVDQFGPSFMQVDPPAGMTILQRKEREAFSPWRYYFQIGNKVIHNFDIYSAKSFKITFYNNKAEYRLTFKDLEIITNLYIHDTESKVFMDVTFISDKNIDIKSLLVASLDPVDTSMAVWDKKDWYSTTDVDGVNKPLFTTKHYSVNGKISERKIIYLLQNNNAISVQNSAERLRYFTKNFTKIPDGISNSSIEQVSCYEQVCSSNFVTNTKDRLCSCLSVNEYNEAFNKDKNNQLLSLSFKNKVLELFDFGYKSLVSKRNIKTKDADFNNFVNSFLPLELNWVSDLDRGWPTGMRGARDCANDFMGYLNYDLDKCRFVLSTLLNNERKDGWFPRQIPFGCSNKYDLRPFSDSTAFVIELFYEYLAYSNDYSILDEVFTYFGSNESGNGLNHLINAAEFYCNKDNIGEHGLVKLNGGDWLDCLNKVGLEGRGESVMVTSQAVLAFKQVNEILSIFGDKYSDLITKFNKQSNEFKNNIKKNAYLKDDGYYRAIFADDGNWYFSNKDKDGLKRIYVPTNAYTIIAGIDHKKDKKVISNINKLNETKFGYKLFTEPFGNPSFEGIGKMGTGDFQPYMFENGAIYNHGANLFYVRALAEAGDYKTLFRALNYALPYNKKFHPESISCLPSYAITNAYNLVPSFRGRSGMCFLTGSIAMIERAIYNWMFGIRYEINNLIIKPCMPKEYGDAIVNESYNGYKLTINYHGYGNSVYKGSCGEICCDSLKINKKDINKDTIIDVYLK